MAESEVVVPERTEKIFNIILFPRPEHAETGGTGHDFLDTKVVNYMKSKYERLNPHKNDPGQFFLSGGTPVSIIIFKESKLINIANLIDSTKSEEYSNDDAVKIVILTHMNYLKGVLSEAGLQCFLEQSLEPSIPNPPSNFTDQEIGAYRARVPGKVIFGIVQNADETLSNERLYLRLKSRGVHIGSVDLSSSQRAVTDTSPASVSTTIPSQVPSSTSDVQSILIENDCEEQRSILENPILLTKKFMEFIKSSNLEKLLIQERIVDDEVAELLKKENNRTITESEKKYLECIKEKLAFIRLTMNELRNKQPSPGTPSSGLFQKLSRYINDKLHFSSSRTRTSDVSEPPRTGSAFPDVSGGDVSDGDPSSSDRRLGFSLPDDEGPGVSIGRSTRRGFVASATGQTASSIGAPSPFAGASTGGGSRRPGSVDAFQSRGFFNRVASLFPDKPRFMQTDITEQNFALITLKLERSRLIHEKDFARKKISEIERNLDQISRKMKNAQPVEYQTLFQEYERHRQDRKKSFDDYKSLDKRLKEIDSEIKGMDGKLSDTRRSFLGGIFRRGAEARAERQAQEIRDREMVVGQPISASTQTPSERQSFEGSGAQLPVFDREASEEDPSMIPLAIVDQDHPFFGIMHRFASIHGPGRIAHMHHYPNLGSDDLMRYHQMMHQRSGSQVPPYVEGLNPKDHDRVLSQYARSGFLGSTSTDYLHILRSLDQTGMHPLSTHVMMIPDGEFIPIYSAVADALGIPNVGIQERGDEQEAMRRLQPTIESQRQLESDIKISLRNAERERIELEAAMQSLKCRMVKDLMDGTMSPCPNGFRTDSREFTMTLMKSKIDASEVGMSKSRAQELANDAMRKLQGTIDRQGINLSFVSPSSTSSSQRRIPVYRNPFSSRKSIGSQRGFGSQRDPWLIFVSSPLVDSNPHISQVHIVGNPIGASQFVSQLPQRLGCGPYAQPLRVQHYGRDPGPGYQRLIGSPRERARDFDTLVDQVRRTQVPSALRQELKSIIYPFSSYKSRDGWIREVQNYNRRYYSDCDKEALDFIQKSMAQIGMEEDGDDENTQRARCCPTDSAEACCGSGGPRYRYKGIIEQKSKCSDSTVIDEQSRVEISTPTLTTYKNITLQITASPTKIVTRNRTRIYENLVPSECLRSVGLSFVTDETDDQDYIEPMISRLAEMRDVPVMYDPSIELARDVARMKESHRALQEASMTPYE